VPSAFSPGGEPHSIKVSPTRNTRGVYRWRAPGPRSPVRRSPRGGLPRADPHRACGLVSTTPTSRPRDQVRDGCRAGDPRRLDVDGAEGDHPALTTGGRPDGRRATAGYVPRRPRANRRPRRGPPPNKRSLPAGAARTAPPYITAERRPRPGCARPPSNDHDRRSGTDYAISGAEPVTDRQPVGEEPARHFGEPVLQRHREPRPAIPMTTDCRKDQRRRANPSGSLAALRIRQRALQLGQVVIADPGTQHPRWSSSPPRVRSIAVSRAT